MSTADVAAEPLVLSRKEQIVRAMDLDSLVNANKDVSAQLEDVKDMLSVIDTEFLRRAAEKNATVIFSKDDQIEILYTEKIDHRFSELQKLRGMIPDEVYNKAVYLEVPEPCFKADTVKLKSIAKKYGSDVAAIVEAGMPKVRVGNPKVKITPRNVPQNVTGNEKALAA